LAAAEALLCKNPLDLHGCHQDFAFWYLVTSLSLHFQRIRSQSCPRVRFCIYWEPEVPSGKDWEARCTLKMIACLWFHVAFESLVDKEKCATQHKKLQKHFAATLTMSICWWWIMF
jgi:hypothetical protein